MSNLPSRRGRAGAACATGEAGRKDGGAEQHDLPPRERKSQHQEPGAEHTDRRRAREVGDAERPWQVGVRGAYAHRPQHAVSRGHHTGVREGEREQVADHGAARET